MVQIQGFVHTTVGTVQQQMLWLINLKESLCHFTFVTQIIILYHELIHFFLYGEAIGCKDWIINPCFIFHVIKSASEKKKTV